MIRRLLNTRPVITGDRYLAEFAMTPMAIDLFVAAMAEAGFPVSRVYQDEPDGHWRLIWALSKPPCRLLYKGADLARISHQLPTPDFDTWHEHRQERGHCNCVQVTT